MREALADAIARLPEREKLVVTLYYYEELTLREIGEVLGVTESRVSQLHTKAILRLKARLAGAAHGSKLNSQPALSPYLGAAGRPGGMETPARPSRLQSARRQLRVARYSIGAVAADGLRRLRGRVAAAHPATSSSDQPPRRRRRRPPTIRPTQSFGFSAGSISPSRSSSRPSVQSAGRERLPLDGLRREVAPAARLEDVRALFDARDHRFTRFLTILRAEPRVNASPSGFTLVSEEFASMLVTRTRRGSRHRWPRDPGRRKRTDRRRLRP